MSKLFTSLHLPPRFAFAAVLCGFALALSAILKNPQLAGASALLAFPLAWASAVDIHRFILPDLITIGLVLLGIVLHIHADPPAGVPFVIGAAAGYLSLVFVASLYRQRRGQHGLGMGDAKLFAAAGAWLGWIALPTVLLIASTAAIAVYGVTAMVSKDLNPARPIAFGPFIAMGLWIVWLFGPLTL